MALFAKAPLLCAAFFAIAPLLCVQPQKEIQIPLYIHQVYSGPTANQATVVQGYNGTRFGETAVLDWTIRDGPDLSSAKVIGRAQGFNMNLDRGERWYLSLNLVFNDASRFSGSTLEVTGFIPYAHELSIIGGTGEFTMARGVAMYNLENITIPYQRVYRVNVHAYYSSMDSMAVYGKSGYNSKLSEPIAVN